MLQLFFSFTLDAFCEIAYGFPWNSIDHSVQEAATPAVGVMS